MADKDTPVYDDITFEDDPLAFGLAFQKTGARKFNANEAVPKPTDTLDAYDPKSLSTDQVGQALDEVEISASKGWSDQVGNVVEEEIVTLRHHHDTGVLPRLDPDKVETEAQALDFMYNEVLRRFRFNQYEDMLPPPVHRLEVEDALYDALEEINQYIQPRSSWELLHFVKKGRRYRRVLFLGAAKNILLMLYSHWTSAGCEVVIEDFSVENKTSDISSLYEEVKSVFQEMLTQMKEYDRLTAKISTFSTGKRRYGSGSYNSVTTRVTRIVRNGGMLG